MLNGFFRLNFLSYVAYRGHSFMTSTKNRGERSGWHKILANFANGCAWFLGKGFFSYSYGPPRARLINLFLSVIYKDFLLLFGCLLLQCFLEARLIYSSITETKEIQRLIMTVDSINLCLLSCHLFFFETLNILRFGKEKSYV